MLEHLSNEELTELSLHSDEQALTPVHNALSAWHQRNAELGDDFWERQRAAIWKKIGAREKAPTRRRVPVLAWSAALLVLGSALLLMRHEPTTISQPAPQADADSALLAEVEAEMDSNGPAALQPAARLAEEIGRTHSPASSTAGQIKEKNTQVKSNQQSWHSFYCCHSRCWRSNRHPRMAQRCRRHPPPLAWPCRDFTGMPWASMATWGSGGKTRMSPRNCS